MGFENLFC